MNGPEALAQIAERLTRMAGRVGSPSHAADAILSTTPPIAAERENERREEIALEPCPFCGGKAAFTPRPNKPNGMIVLGCADPDCVGHDVAFDFVTDQLAAAAWNSRALPPLLQQGEAGPVAWRWRQLHPEIEGPITGWSYWETKPELGNCHRWEIGPLYAAPPASQALADPVGEEDKGNHDCLAKRRPGEPMFILLGRDPDAHNIVRTWAERRLAAGGDPEHCQMGMDIAERMRIYAAEPANKPASAPDADAYEWTVPNRPKGKTVDGFTLPPPAPAEAQARIEALEKAISKLVDDLYLSAARDRDAANAKDGTTSGVAATAGYIFAATATENAAKRVRSLLSGSTPKAAGVEE